MKKMEKGQSSRQNKHSHCQQRQKIAFNLSRAVTETFVLTPYDLIPKEK